MLASAYKHEVVNYQKREQELKKTRDEADKMVEGVEKMLAQDNALKGIVGRCGDDTCIDLYIHFDRNKDTITQSDEVRAIEGTCIILRSALDNLPSNHRREVQLTIEGHTDSSQPDGLKDPRDLFRYNWNLSADRATSVLYLFQQCGLKPPHYQVVAIGYADSMPLCFEDTDKCSSQNRRTTIRLHPDTKKIEARLSAGN